MTMRLTAWAARLPEARTLPARLIDWLDWSCDVTTYGTGSDTLTDDFGIIRYRSR